MLSESDAQLMALRQSVQHSRQRIEHCIDALEDLVPDLFDPQQEKLLSVILSLKYTHDFILGEPTS